MNLKLLRKQLNSHSNLLKKNDFIKLIIESNPNNKNKNKLYSIKNKL